MNLYLPIEILNRELDSKLLIAMECASRGMKVYSGRLTEYLLRDFFAPGIVLQKSITPSPVRLKELEYYKKKNFIVTSLDEEVGLVEHDDNYVRRRYSNESIELTDRIFTWGKFDYDNLTKKFPKHKKKFIKSGNPRIDFWRNDFKFFFERKKFKYQNYIFFSLNFALRTNDELNDRIKYYRSAGYTDRGDSISKLKKIHKDSYRMLKHFSNLIDILSKQINLMIIVRPHPIDKLSNFNFLKKYKSVRVEKEGNISDWIHNAKIVIHSGCAGGLEASIRGKPTVSYMPFKPNFGYQFSNKFSEKTTNLSDCLKIIKNISIDDNNFKKRNLRSFKLRAYNFSSNTPSYKVIADEMMKLIEKKNTNQNNDLFLKYKFKIRDIRSKLLNLTYGNIKFSFFNRSETLERFKTLKEFKPKYKGLKLKFLKKDIIQITKESKNF